MYRPFYPSFTLHIFLFPLFFIPRLSLPPLSLSTFFFFRVLLFPRLSLSTFLPFHVFAFPVFSLSTSFTFHVHKRQSLQFTLITCSGDDDLGRWSTQQRGYLTFHLRNHACLITTLAETVPQFYMMSVIKVVNSDYKCQRIMDK